MFFCRLARTTMPSNVSFSRRHRALRCPLMVASARAPNADAGCAALRLWDVGKTLLYDGGYLTVAPCDSLPKEHTFKLPISSCALHLPVSQNSIRAVSSASQLIISRRRLHISWETILSIIQERASRERPKI